MSQPQSSRTSFWVRTFAHARRDGGWVRVPRLYTRTTAAQLASDISNAHRREPRVLRVRGIHTGETWEARWEPSIDGPPGDYHVWVRLTDRPAPASTPPDDVLRVLRELPDRRPIDRH